MLYPLSQTGFGKFIFIILFTRDRCMGLCNSGVPWSSLKGSDETGSPTFPEGSWIVRGQFSGDAPQNWAPLLWFWMRHPRTTAAKSRELSSSCIENLPLVVIACHIYRLDGQNVSQSLRLLYM
uniref:Uncharacterized protein n=1 Tax=Pipistrellus kuhlii TaxID=59472 RepID=A0A7J7RAF4_PIPKU|nr:hypothetical protein mPipKuh1_010704 [Pipistrellus kuhlii]